MAKRRRIDWSVILHKDAPKPTWGGSRAPSDTVDLLLGFADLFAINELDALLKRTVELALHPVGLVRAGLYLYDDQLDLMLGSWGTDLRRKVIDEHHAMFQLDEPGRRVAARAMSGEAHWTVVEDCPIIVNSPAETKVVGQGWVVCTPIRSGRALLGMLYSDAGLTDASVDPEKQGPRGRAVHRAGTSSRNPARSRQAPLGSLVPSPGRGRGSAHAGRRSVVKRWRYRQEDGRQPVALRPRLQGRHGTLAGRAS
jgi:hypothetical protein